MSHLALWVWVWVLVCVVATVSCGGWRGHGGPQIRFGSSVRIQLCRRGGGGLSDRRQRGGFVHLLFRSVAHRLPLDWLDRARDHHCRHRQLQTEVAGGKGKTKRQSQEIGLACPQILKGFLADWRLLLLLQNLLFTRRRALSPQTHGVLRLPKQLRIRDTLKQKQPINTQDIVAKSAVDEGKNSSLCPHGQYFVAHAGVAGRTLLFRKTKLVRLVTCGRAVVTVTE